MAEDEKKTRLRPVRTSSDSDDGLLGRHPGYRRGVALLPNLITTGALFSGFYAIVAGMNGRFVAAGLAVYIAMLLDAADGRVARLTRSESDFGAEFDSLSDMVAFGVAPALVAFSWALSSLDQVGWVVTFVYMACAALRLARFNTQETDHRTFTGLPSPAAAAVVAGAVWVSSEALAGEAPGLLAAIGLGVITAAAGLLMVSNFKYFSPKVINFRGRVGFFTLVGVTLGFAVVLADPPKLLLLAFTVYALSGPGRYLWTRLRERGKAGKGEKAGEEG